MPFKAVAGDKFCDRFLYIRGSKALSADHGTKFQVLFGFLKQEQNLKMSTAANIWWRMKGKLKMLSAANIWWRMKG